MGRTSIALFAVILGAVGSTVALPIPEANAAFCAKQPRATTDGCRRYQCVRRGPCQVGRLFTRRGCLRYACTTMGAGGIPDRRPDQPVPHVPNVPPRPPQR